MGTKVFVVVIMLINVSELQAQKFWSTNPKKEKKIIKSGSYFGIQSGKLYAGEIGIERQWKEGKLIGPNTHALHLGVNYSYDFSKWNPILGYDFGYWYRKSNLGLTFGGTICMRSNFENYRLGFTPTIGYKIWQLHIQTGYHFLYPFYAFNPNTFESNTLFLSARFVLINEREVRTKE